MNINELTIGQVKEISELFGGQADKKSTMLSSYIGKYVICRSRNEGVNAGFVKDIDETGVVLEDARRLSYPFIPANKQVSWYEGVAKHGISNDSKVGTAVEKCIIEDYSLTVCTDLAKNSLIEAKDYEQN